MCPLSIGVGPPVFQLREISLYLPERRIEMSAVLKHHDFSMPNGPIAGPSAWYGPDMAVKEDWSRLFSDEELAELDTAMRNISAKGIGVIDITRENFSLPKLGSVFAGIRHELLQGRGFMLLRGIPV